MTVLEYTKILSVQRRAYVPHVVKNGHEDGIIFCNV